MRIKLSAASSALAIAALLPSTALAQGWSCTVNDSLSHGTVGDDKLSLNEAIRVMNTDPTLPIAALSPAEIAQFNFNGTIQGLQFILVDAAITPVITVQQTLAQVTGDTNTHIDTDFTGINGRPILDASGLNGEVLPARTNHFHFDNFVVQGGTVAITFDSSLHFHPNTRGRIKNCLFIGQSQLAVEVRIPNFPPGEKEEMDFVDTTFLDIPTAIRLLDNGLSGIMDVTGSNLTIDGCATGIQIEVNGGSSNCKAHFDRTNIYGADNAVVMTRGGASSSAFDLRFVYGDIFATRSAVDLTGVASAPTSIWLHHVNVRGGADAFDYALRTTPNTARFDVFVGETHFDGNVLLQTNGLGATMRLHNSRFENGAVIVDSIGPTASFQYDVFESAPLTIAARQTKPVNVFFSELVRSSVTDLSAPSHTTLSGCYVGSSSLSNVNNVSQAPARYLGQAWVTPDDPPAGGFVDLDLDLQPGTAVVWGLGPAVANPLVSTVPYRFYTDLLFTLALPGQYTSNASIRLAIPNNPLFKGVELYAMPVLFATAGQSYVPLLLPRGGRFKIQ